MTDTITDNSMKADKSCAQPTLTVRALFGRPLEYAAESFDDFWWRDLPSYAQKQATILGYTEATWNKEDDEDDSDAPEIMARAWKDLTAEQKSAKLYFGWDWDADESDDESDDESLDAEAKADEISDDCLGRVRRHASDFIPKRGLQGDNQEFWNTLGEVEGRDVLIQTVEAYEALLSHGSFGKYLTTHYTKKMGGLVETDVDTDSDSDCGSSCSTSVSNKNVAQTDITKQRGYLHHPTFGEQVIVEGLDSPDICVGDIFEVSKDGLKLQVSSPRVACAYVDKKHRSAFGAKGIRRHSMVEGHAGFFVRVLRAGSLRDGDVLHRTENPRPKFTLAYLAKSMYGEGSIIAALSNRVDWKRSVEELEEIINIEELAEYEWKDPARKALKKIQQKGSKATGATKATSSRMQLRQPWSGRSLSRPVDLGAFFQRLRFLGAMWHLFLQFIAPFTKVVTASARNGAP